VTDHTPVAGGRPLILYITGMMRCGSTFVGNILNEMPDTVHIGERYFLWKNAQLRDGTNTLCGCGRDLLECEVWSGRLGDPDRPGERQRRAQRLWHLQQRFLRTRHTAPRLAELLGRKGVPAQVTELSEAIAAVHRGIAADSGIRLIVDSSKNAADAALLARRTDLDVRILHMVRDPRATVSSYLAPKDYLERMSASRTLSYWAAFNLTSEAVGAALGRDRYLRIRYEDFTRHPRTVIDRIVRFAGFGDTASIKFDTAGPEDPGTSGPPGMSNASGSTGTSAAPATFVVLGANHTVTGNPDRLRQGRIEIKQSERWRETMSRREKRAVFAGAAPLMLRYGYGR
jgi:hypothetical protein